MNMHELKIRFSERFGDSDESIRVFFAPGRVNLIGDHIDYNGGQVFPCAIEQGTALAIRRTTGASIKLASDNFDLTATLSEEETQTKYDDHWINYPLGILQQLRQANLSIGGFECLYSGNMPSAAGLSSSASIEVVTAFALNALYVGQMSLTEIAQLSQRAENQFVGVQCGIMDQYAVANGKEGHAMLLDCESLDCQQIPLDLQHYTFVLVNTNQRRELSESRYNERVQETLDALKILQNQYPISQLAELSPTQLSESKGLFENRPIEYSRTLHVVGEQNRVVHAVAALQAGQLNEFGRLMYESHDSLRDHFGVSSDPLNLLVDLTRDNKDVLGARLTGAGFGGCTVNLVRRDAIETFKQSISEPYQNATGLTATFLDFKPSQGVREITGESDGVLV
jgi:galactokinase